MRLFRLVYNVTRDRAPAPHGNYHMKFTKDKLVLELTNSASAMTWDDVAKVCSA